MVLDGSATYKAFFRSHKGLQLLTKILFGPLDNYFGFRVVVEAGAEQAWFDLDKKSDTVTMENLHNCTQLKLPVHQL